MKIVINRCYGGFGLSPEAQAKYLRKKGEFAYFYKQTKYSYKNGKDEYTKISLDDASSDGLCLVVLTKDFGNKFNCFTPEINQYYFSYYDIERNDPYLVEVVEELGEKANGTFSELKVVEVPDGIEWDIDDYDGVESVEEAHRTWC